MKHGIQLMGRHYQADELAELKKYLENSVARFDATVDELRAENAKLKADRAALVEGVKEMSIIAGIISQKLDAHCADYCGGSHPDLPATKPATQSWNGYLDDAHLHTHNMQDTAKALLSNLRGGE